MSQSQNDSQLGRQRKLGTCSVCLRQLSLTSAGVIHVHGLHGSQCTGSGCAPTDASITTQTALSSGDGPQQQKQQQATASPLDAQYVLDVVVGARTRVMKYVPKASRMMAAAKLSVLLDRITTNPDNVDAWQLLLLFTYSCFEVPERGGKRHKASLASKVNKSLSDFLTVDHQGKSVPTSFSNRKSRPNDDNSLAARVSTKIEEGDVRGAIRLAVSVDTLAPYNDATATALRQLHPPRASPTTASPLTTKPDVNYQSNQSDCGTPTILTLTERDIMNAIKSFPAGSAGGMDGLRPQHLKDMTSPFTGVAGQQLLTSLTEFANMCLAGHVPPSMRPVFYGATLCALAKKGGGVRPIAVGSTLRRLVAKAACRAVRDAVVVKLAPSQLGFGVQQGGEAAAHAARSFLANLIDGHALLKIDFTNAFNTLSREEMLNVIHNELPELYPFIDSCYSDPSFLRFGQYTIISDEGPQQGDPLGPLLFCTTAMSLVKRIKSQCNVWYMDDGTMGGDVDTLLTDFLMLIEKGREIGLVVNVAKCEIITNDDEVVQKFKAIAPDISHVRPASAMLLGAPIGGEQCVDEILAGKLFELRRLSDRLSMLDAHDALFLLKNCFSIPKLTYTLRSAPCYSRKLLTEYDDVIRSTLQNIINVTLSDDVWEQATLPVASGGLGIRRATDVALPAFMSSVTCSHTLITQLLPRGLHDTSGTCDPAFKAAVLEWQSRTGSATIQPPYATAQKMWDTPLVRVQEVKVLSAALDQAGKARLTAAASPYSGAFLHARPCTSLGTRLDNSSLRIAIALRLGAPICLPHVCVCGAAVDNTGRHGLSCRKSAGRLSRHSAVNDLIKRALMSAEIPSRLEPKSLTRNDDKRPDGLTLTPWSSGRCLAWDFTCPDTMAPSHLNTAVSRQGAVASEAEDKKRSKYASISSTYCFVPVAIETLGAFGQDADDFVCELGRRIAVVTGDQRATDFLRQRISVAVQRGNAACVLGTTDTPADTLDVIYYL